MALNNAIGGSFVPPSVNPEDGDEDLLLAAG
jgi:hypothetical protein